MNSSSHPPYRWALLSNTTLSPLVSRLKTALHAENIEHKVFLSEHGEAIQQVLVPTSGLYLFQPDLVLLYWDLEIVQPGLALSFPFESPEKQRAILKRIAIDTISLVKAIQTHSSASVLVNSYAPPVRTALGIGIDRVYRNAIRRLNLQLEVELGSLPQCYIYDCDSLWAEAGLADRDRRFELLAQFPFGPKMLQLLVTEWLRYYRALQGLSRKCIIVDLDNTLWGGILGEDGPHKIQMGDTPEGRPYRRLQQSLKALSLRGVLLAIASRNNPDDALAVLRTHPDMVLREEDFSAFQINWDDKAANLSRIVSELNIGLQHVVFLDDSPAEREWVRKSHPEVLVPEFPSDRSRYSEMLLDCHLDTLALTPEDFKRAEMYREERQRRAFQETVPTFEEFLVQLNLEVRIASLRPQLLDRAVQLCQRTNQFNLTTRRYTAGQLQKPADSATGKVFLMNVRDRFGEYGWSGLAVVQANGAQAEIDAFLVSCRVLGKGVEFALFSAVVSWARERGCTELEGVFLPTDKNAVCAGFYTKCGMMQVDTRTPNSSKTFRASLASLPSQLISHIQVSYE